MGAIVTQRHDGAAIWAARAPAGVRTEDGAHAQVWGRALGGSGGGLGSGRKGSGAGGVPGAGEQVADGVLTSTPSTDDDWRTRGGADAPAAATDARDPPPREVDFSDGEDASAMPSATLSC